MSERKEITIEFEPVNHIYYVDGEKAKISVTTLIDEQITKTEWNFIDQDLLQRAADRGTDVHSDLEHFVREGTEPRTQECKNFADYIKKNGWTIESPLCEFKLAIKHTAIGADGLPKTFILSGTADLLCKLNGKWVVVDHKTTSTVHTESVRWQMSLLDYMARKLNGYYINGILFEYIPAEELYVFHFDKQAKFTPVKVEPISDVEILRLLDAEARNEEYHPTPVDILTPRQQEALEEIQKKLCSLKAAKALLDAQEKQLRGEIEQAFATHPDVKKVDFGMVSVSYTPPSSRITFDVDRFKTEHPDLYEQYLVSSPVKGSVTITLAKKAKDQIEAHASDLQPIPQLSKPPRRNIKRGFFS